MGGGLCKRQHVSTCLLAGPARRRVRLQQQRIGRGAHRLGALYGILLRSVMGVRAPGKRRQRAAAQAQAQRAAAPGMGALAPVGAHHRGLEIIQIDLPIQHCRTRKGLPQGQERRGARPHRLCTLLAVWTSEVIKTAVQ